MPRSNPSFDNKYWIIKSQIFGLGAHIIFLNIYLPFFGKVFQEDNSLDTPCFENFKYLNNRSSYFDEQ